MGRWGFKLAGEDENPPSGRTAACHLPFQGRQEFAIVSLLSLT